MRNLKYVNLCLILISFFLLESCTPSSQIIGNNDLDKDFQSTFSAIEKGKSKSKNIEKLNTILLKMISNVKTQKDTLSYETLEGRTQIYELDFYLADKISKSTPYIGSRYAGKLDSLESEKSVLNQRLQTEYFELGKKALIASELNSDKLKGQTAFLAFEKAEKYGNTNSELTELKARSEKLSYFIYNIKTNVSFDERYEFLVRERFREVETINRNFKKIYFDRTDLENVDCQVDIIFDPIQIIEDPRQSSNTFEKRVQTGSKTTTSSSGIETETAVYSEVRATVVKETLNKIYQWNVKVQITPKSNNCLLEGKIFLETVKATATEINVSGDERAVPADMLRVDDAGIIIDNENVDQLIEKIYRRIELIIL